jgi:hypothetical protein
VPSPLSDGIIDGVNIRVRDIEAQFGTALDLDVSEDTAHRAPTSSVRPLVTHPEDDSVAEMPRPRPVTSATTPSLAGPAIVEPPPPASSGLLSAPPSTAAAASPPAVTRTKQGKTAPATRRSTRQR